MRKRYFFAAILAILGVCLLLLLRPVATPVPAPARAPEDVTSLTPPTAAPLASPPPYAAPGGIALREVAPAPLRDASERSPLADHLNAPDRTSGEDLRAVMSLFDHYRRVFGGLPGGENNRQVVRALTGNNPRRIAFISPDNPAINSEGELTDRWNTPLFFHLISRDLIELRSAGGDKEFYTVDDVILGSPALAGRDDSSSANERR